MRDPGFYLLQKKRVERGKNEQHFRMNGRPEGKLGQISKSTSRVIEEGPGEKKWDVDKLILS